MEEEEESHPMLYILCVIAGGAAILNTVLLLWQALRIKKDKGFQFAKYSVLLLDAAFSVTALALVLLVMYKDVGGDSVCTAGGYLILAGSQLSLWFQATSSISLLLWKKKTLSPDLQRRNVPIFFLIASAQCLVICVISLLPFLKLPYFDNTLEEYYYICTPLRVPNEKGWAFSTLLLILDWIACLICGGALIKISLHYSSCRQPPVPAAEKLEELQLNGSKLRQQRQTFLTLVISLVGWTSVLVIINITFFSKGKLDAETTQWILGFCLGVTLCLRPLSILIHHHLSRWMDKNHRRQKSFVVSLFTSCPQSLHRLARLPDSHQVGITQSTYFTKARLHVIAESYDLCEK